MFATTSGAVMPVNNRPVIVRNVADVQPKIIYASSFNKQPVIKAPPATSQTTSPPPATYTMYREPSQVSVYDYKEKKAKLKTISKEQADDASVHSELGSTNSQMGYRNSRKLLSGFHPYYDKVGVDFKIISSHEGIILNLFYFKNFKQRNLIYCIYNAVHAVSVDVDDVARDALAVRISCHVQFIVGSALLYPYFYFCVALLF